MTPAPHLQPLGGGDPKVIGEWRLLGRLGAGGMGVVYLAERMRGEQAALKIIHAGYAHDPTFRTRFKREVHASRSVSGRYVASVLDADTDGDPAWLATEYIPGPTLSAFVDDHGPLPDGLVLPLAAGLLEGLATIHGAGIVHRDLKPSNVLLTEAAPVIIDFGIASAADATSLTGTGIALGSAGWMAPEQLRGTPAGPPADIFAWGALVAFAATGRPPFGTGRPDALGYRVAHEPPDLSGVPFPLRSVVEEALHKDAAERPSLDDLRARVGADGDATVATIAAGWEAPTEIDTLVGAAGPVGLGRVRPSWRSTAFVGAVLATLAAAFGVYLLGTRGNSTDSLTQRDASLTKSTESSTTTSTSTTTKLAIVDPTAVDYANFTHIVTCAEGPENITLVDGEAQQGDIAMGDPYIALHDVFFMDVDSDGHTEALAHITCSYGANGNTSQILTYQAAGERPVRLGSTIFFGFSPIVGDGSIITHEPVYGPDDSRCCPSGYRRDTYQWSTGTRDFIVTDSQPISEADLPSTRTSAHTPGEPCDLGSHRDCIDPEGDGEGIYLIGGGDCMDTFAPESSGLCSDLDGDGHAGYPDSG